MNDTRRTFEPAVEEQASLHVLDLLPTDEARDFERRLATDPALRELVRDLQGNLEALVLAAPPRPAPLRVWGRIAAEIRTGSAPNVPAWVRTACWQLLAAAACLALGALGHAWWSGLTPPGNAEVLNAQPEIPNLFPAPSVTVVTVTNFIALAPLSPSPTAGTPGSKPADAATSAENARLQGRIQVLAAQVSALNQVLQQQQELELPQGVTRLHVFQLVGTNHLADPGTGRATSDTLPDLLAQLAATQLSQAAGAIPGGQTSGSGQNPISPVTLPTPTVTVLTPATGQAPTPAPTPTTAQTPSQTPSPTPSPAIAQNTPATPPPNPTPNPPPPGALSPAPYPGSASFVANPGSLTLGGASALGFVAPDLGIGSIALSNDNPLGEGEVFQVWTLNNSAGFGTSFLSLGTAYAEGPVVVLKFNLPSTDTSVPSLIVTREPTGGSTTPTGPVIVGPKPTP